MDNEKGDPLIKGLMESMKMDAYVESRIREMHVCFICGRVGYKKLPMKKIGNKWICIDCLRELKEALDTLEEWEQELAIQEGFRKEIGKEFNR